MRPLLLMGALVAGSCLAAACGGSQSTSTTKRNISGLGTDSHAFAKCTKDCDAMAKECKDQRNCWGACHESGECVAYSYVVTTGGKTFSCAGLRFPAPTGSTDTGTGPTTGADTGEGSTAQTDTGATTAETDTGQATSSTGETPAPSEAPVGCLGPSIELTDLDPTALGARLRHSPDDKLAWSETTIRLTGTRGDRVLRVTTVEP
ncbi:MAG: hypothetical protein E6G45_12355 [Actinobacteria bacterium]|nr:MAG: hypothetical protein E6G45_12355 [Actinomycetota bacterium]